MFLISTKTWKPHPLSTVIIEILSKKGAITDIELYKLAKEIRGDLCFSILNKELLRLEIKGLVRVSSLTKAKRRVELAKARAHERRQRF